MATNEPKSDTGSLYRAYARKVAIWAGKHAPPELETQDLIQDAFEALIRSGTSPNSELAYLSTIAKHLAFRAWRRQSLPTEYFNEIHHGFDGFEPEQSDPWTRDALERDLGTLPPGLRLPFHMYVVQGCTATEIGSRLHLAEGTVRSRLRRARAHLRRRIEAWLDHPDRCEL